MEQLLEEQNDNFFKRCRNAIVTFVIFVIFISLLPFFVIFYTAITVCRYVWLRRLCYKAKHLELVKNITARTAMDTHRNQAIITILLQVKGQCDAELVKRRIKETVVECRRTDGSLRFPHLKTPLISYWGRYAWVKDSSEFNLDNHVKHDNKPIFRNRPVSSANIQEYISELITKYIPPWNKYPPWELRVITTEPDRFYILARLHHLYISEDGIAFGDLLMVKGEHLWTTSSEARQQRGSRMEDADSVENILASIVKQPKALPSIYHRFNDFSSNSWNEIINAYDPQENPTVLKGNYTIFVCLVIASIVLYSTFKQLLNQNQRHRQNGWNQLTAWQIFRKEASKRQLSISLVLRGCLHTSYPTVLGRCLIKACLMVVSLLLGLPKTFIRLSLYNIPTYFQLSLLLVQAFIELLRLFSLLYVTPRVIVEEIVAPIFTKPKHHLQKLSLSGRKVVNWTEPIPMQVIKSIRENTATASCEIELYGLAASLHEYFRRLKLQEPSNILTTVRFVPEEDVLKSSDQISSGLLCLPLPMRVPNDDPLYGLHMVQLALQNALTGQTALYLASLWQYDYSILTTIFPSIVVRIILYVLSKRYPIMMTQIEPHNGQLRRLHLIWDQEVEAFFYWRPPQANISMSVSLISYGDEFRFVVMTDAELAPDYNIIVSQYPNKLHQLAKESEDYTPPKFVMSSESLSVFPVKKN